jgi:adenylyltransferase/sulfurtransferase
MTPLADDQIDRYSRQILLPEIGARGQERLIAASAAILGAGSLAHLCALYLAGAGVGRIGLLMPDTSPAVADEALAQDLTELNPEVRIEHLTLPSPLAPRTSNLAPLPSSLVPRPSSLAPVLSAFDVVVDTRQGAPISHDVAATAVETGRPLLAAGLRGSQGWLARHGGGGCVVCVSLHEAEAVAERAHAEPSPLGVVASLLAFEAIATLLGWDDERRGSWLHYDGAAMNLKTVRFAAHPDCAACGRQS